MQRSTQSKSTIWCKSILLGGDFRQILPVIPRGTREEIIHAYFSSSPLWHKFKLFTLNENT
jgi:hypothetical protein